MKQIFILLILILLVNKGFSALNYRKDSVGVSNHDLLTSTGTKTHTQLEAIVSQVAVDTTAASAVDNIIKQSTHNISGLEGGVVGDIYVYDGSKWVRFAKGSAGQVLTVAGSSVTWATPTATSGGVSISTFVAKIICGGDVFVASTSFIPNMGSWIGLNEPFPITITGIAFETVLVSTVGSTMFNIAYTSATGSVLYWQYINTTDIEVATNTMTNVSGWIVPNQCPLIDTFPCVLSLHTKQIPLSGTIPQEYSCYIRYWRKL